MAIKTAAKRERAFSANGRGGRQELAGLQESGKAELQQQLIELRAKGWSIRKIASKLKIGKTTAANWIAELEEEIAAAKAIELEALYERALMSKEARIRRLSQQLKAIQKELKERGLEDVPTEKLLKLQLEYLAALDEEYTEPRVLSEDEMAELKALRGHR